MNLKSFKTIFSGPVNGRTEVIFEATKAETDELRAALAVVDKWKKQALKVAPKDSDWTMVDYAVKTDTVIVGVENGACG